MAENSLVVR